jgi:hypothetical protein
MDTPALQLASRFAYSPNAKGYCGKDSAPAKFIKCITTGECETIESEFTHFIALHPYLKTIATITNQPLGSYPVIESYWIGNDELYKAKLDDYQILLDNFKAQGIPNFLHQELSERWPKVFIPHHLFQILHVGVGRASGSVPYNLESINNCMIRWGNVISSEDNNIKVEVQSLKHRGEKYARTTTQLTLPLDTNFVPEVKVGDIVAVHWNHVAKILTSIEVANLTHWTDKILEEL